MQQRQARVAVIGAGPSGLYAAAALLAADEPIGVDVLDHDRALAVAFLHEFNVPYPSVYDGSGSLTAAFEVDYPPTILLVDRRGMVVARYPGEASESQLRTLINQRLLV